MNTKKYKAMLLPLWEIKTCDERQFEIAETHNREVEQKFKPFLRGFGINHMSRIRKLDEGVVNR